MYSVCAHHNATGNVIFKDTSNLFVYEKINDAENQGKIKDTFLLKWIKYRTHVPYVLY